MVLPLRRTAPAIAPQSLWTYEATHKATCKSHERTEDHQERPEEDQRHSLRDQRHPRAASCVCRRASTPTTRCSRPRWPMSRLSNWSTPPRCPASSATAWPCPTSTRATASPSAALPPPRCPTASSRPGGIGYDINCGVRLLASNLERDEFMPFRDDVVDALARNVPTGLGRGGDVQRQPRRDGQGAGRRRTLGSQARLMARRTT